MKNSAWVIIERSYWAANVRKILFTRHSLLSANISQFVNLPINHIFLLLNSKMLWNKISQTFLNCAILGELCGIMRNTLFQKPWIYNFLFLTSELWYNPSLFAARFSSKVGKTNNSVLHRLFYWWVILGPVHWLKFCCFESNNYCLWGQIQLVLTLCFSRQNATIRFDSGKVQYLNWALSLCFNNTQNVIQCLVDMFFYI